MMLRGRGFPSVEVDITQNPVAREYMTKELGYSMALVVVVEHDDHWCDMRPNRIAAKFAA